MQDIELATREVMWNIPFSFKVAMYVMLIAAFAVFAKGMWQKALFITKGTGLSGLKQLLPHKLNRKNFFETLFFTGKVTRKPNVGIFHSLIYYGFVILWIATDLVAIHADTPFQIYKGWTYIIISFLADIAGLAILAGLALAFYRRYARKPDSLSATNPNREYFMYGMLAALVIIGYLLEGLRILGTGMPIDEARWSPVGWMVANFFQTFGWSNDTLALVYRTLWFGHMANTMAFFASIPYSKFSHIVLLPIAALLTPARRGGVLMPMDFEDENAETFGLGKASELTMKNRLDLLSCVECGRCTDVCPALNAGKNLNPKTIITKARR
ncbi:MAG: hypothetical protein CME71_03100, partial [Halobacteriovorax sp.]|nr:hypothetical protein [Halobacteriovorax sp.]